jgi:subfamily B ATP-binding cassette protein MsbA
MMLTCAALFLILLQFGLTQIVRKPMMKVIRTNLDRNAELSNLLQESFTSVRVMKSFGGEEYELAKIGEGITALVKSDVRSNIVKHLQDPVRLVLDSVAMVGIVLIAAQQLMKGNLSLQGFVLFIYVGQLLVNPINKFAVTISWAHALLASYSRLSNIFKIEPQVLDGSKDKDHFVDAINVKDVKFDYGGGPVLHNISFEIKKNEIIAIVGPSGAGKSTLVDLIMRFYDPTNGSIFIDTLDLKQIRYDSYRKIFGVVPQRNILFNDTIRNNILYGRNFLSENDVLEAIRISNAEEFIKNMPKGLDTVVGEKGVFLSGGQCQRIAIARAVVSRPDILILDEATSSLDSEAEKQVQKAIDMALENSTAIIIAHRLSTVLHAHKIVVMQKGRIEAMGRHSELLEISPTYKLLYSLQFQDWRKDDKANGYAGR